MGLVARPFHLELDLFGIVVTQDRELPSVGVHVKSPSNPSVYRVPKYAIENSIYGSHDRRAHKCEQKGYEPKSVLE